MTHMHIIGDLGSKLWNCQNMCHGVFQIICVLWLTFLHPYALLGLLILVTLPLYVVYNKWVPRTSFHISANRHCEGCDVKCITKYPVEGVCAVMTRIPSNGLYKGKFPWYVGVLWLHTYQEITLVSRNPLVSCLPDPFWATLLLIIKIKWLSCYRVVKCCDILVL